MQNCEAERMGLCSNFRAEARATDCQPVLSLDLERIVLTLDGVAVDSRALAVGFKKGADGVVSRNLIGGDEGWPDLLFVDLFAVAVFGDIALGGCQTFQETSFERLT